MPEPFVMRPDVGTLTLAGTDYHCQVVTTMLTAEQSENRVEAMCGAVVTYGTTAYFLDVDYFQDWRTGGISAYLWNTAENTEAAFTFSPDDDASPLMTGTVRTRNPSMGGPPRQGARDRIRLACTAKPTLTLDT